MLVPGAGSTAEVNLASRPAASRAAHSGQLAVTKLPTACEQAADGDLGLGEKGVVGGGRVECSGLGPGPGNLLALLNHVMLFSPKGFPLKNSLLSWRLSPRSEPPHAGTCSRTR